MNARSPARSEQPIAVGDLVQVVKPKPCCGSTASMGQIFRVANIRGGDWVLGPCWHCRADLCVPHAQDPADGLWAEISRLKRIPPLSELEGQRTEETRKEPA